MTTEFENLRDTLLPKFMSSEGRKHGTFRLWSKTSAKERTTGHNVFFDREGYAAGFGR